MTNEEIAIAKYNKGIPPSVSTFIDEDTIILGYGKLDIDFEFPLPAHITVKEYGTQSWAEYFRLKGLNKYLATNTETKETSITPYFTREEFFKNQELNPNFTYQIL